MINLQPGEFIVVNISGLPRPVSYFVPSFLSALQHCADETVVEIEAPPGWQINSQTYSYDLCTNGKGRLCSASTYAGSTSYTYTRQGNVSGLTETVQGYPLALSYNYDSYGRPIGTVHPNGMQTEISYSSGRVTSIGARIGGVLKPVVSGVSYEPYGAVNSYSYGNGLSRSIQRDLSGSTTGVFSLPGVQWLTYGYDGVGNINGIDNLFDSFGVQGFTYDPMDRLKTSVRPGVSETWTYDGIGNRKTHKNGTPNHVLNYVGNKLTSIFPLNRIYNNDVLGNRLSESRTGTTSTYIYDGAMRLSYFVRDNAASLCEPTGQCVAGLKGTWQYGYNHAGLRVFKFAHEAPTGMKRYLYSPDGQLQAETTVGPDASVSAVGSQYIWFGGEPVGVVRGGQLYHVHADHLGRPEVVTNAAATTSWRARNNAFTRDVTVMTGFGEFNIGFPEQYYDAETTHYYNWNRHYDPATGRYTQSDPVGLGGGINTFSYVSSSTIMRMDHNGSEGTGCWNNGVMNNVAGEVDSCSSMAFLDSFLNVTPFVGIGKQIWEDNYGSLGFVSYPSSPIHGVLTYSSSGATTAGLGLNVGARYLENKWMAEAHPDFIGINGERHARYDIPSHAANTGRLLGKMLGYAGLALELPRYIQNVNACRCRG